MINNNIYKGFLTIFPETTPTNIEHGIEHIHIISTFISLEPTQRILSIVLNIFISYLHIYIYNVCMYIYIAYIRIGDMIFF